MSLLQMSFSAAVFILAVLLLRALTIHRLPKKTFVVLWGVVLLRLLVPFSVPSLFSVYTVASRAAENSYLPLTALPAAQPGFTQPATFFAAGPQAAIADPQTSWLFPVWMTGLIACALFFTVGYLRCRRKFATATPVTMPAALQWLAAHRLKRKVAICESDQIAAPLTYGILHPVILLPKRAAWPDEKQLHYILAHEWTHIRRFDALIKLLLIAALCIHWFNPMVWVMFLLANRDLELSCDETVVHTFGETQRAAYARVLIGMEETKSAFMPLCNSFSKNAIEERITAIMKTKKLTFCAALVAVVLVFAVSVTFATSPSARATSSSDKTIGTADREILKKFQFSGYEAMTIAAYRDKAITLGDTAEYHSVLDRIGGNEAFYNLRDSNQDAAFLFYILQPLTSETWEITDFDDYVLAPQDTGASEPALLEYGMQLTILNPSAVTVGQYDAARLAVKQSLQDCLQQKSNAQLRDEAHMAEALDAAVASLKRSHATDALQLEINYSYRPLSELSDETMREILLDWEASLAPYAAFGITYEVDSLNGQATLFHNGHPIRGIYDTLEGRWISNSATFDASDANLSIMYAVYTDGRLTGLRTATAQEEQSLLSSHSQADPAEPRVYPHANADDYASLLALKTDNYQTMSVTDFNAALLDWANEDFDRTQRIQEDIARNDFEVTLSAKELSFLTSTTYLSNEENTQRIKSLKTGKPEEDPWCSGIPLQRSAAGNEAAAWCSLWYQFQYHISDKDTVTISTRDACINGFLRETEAFWSTQSLDALLSLSREDIVAHLQQAAATHSNDSVTIILHPDQIQWEAMDERT